MKTVKVNHNSKFKICESNLFKRLLGQVIYSARPLGWRRASEQAKWNPSTWSSCANHSVHSWIQNGLRIIFTEIQVSWMQRAGWTFKSMCKKDCLDSKSRRCIKKKKTGRSEGWKCESNTDPHNDTGAVLRTVPDRLIFLLSSAEKAHRIWQAFCLHLLHMK